MRRCKEVPFKSYGRSQLRFCWWDRKWNLGLGIADWPSIKVYSVGSV